MNRLIQYSYALPFILILLHCSFSEAADSGNSSHLLRSGWYEIDPFQYKDTSSGYPVLTGLDIEIMRRLSLLAGYEISFVKKSWQQQILDIETGKQDLATGATFTKERSEFAHFSIPYREETNLFYMRPHTLLLLKANSVEELLKKVKQQKLVISVINGYIYADKSINQFINDRNNQTFIIKSENTFMQFTQLINYKADLFIADEIVASTVAWRHKLNTSIMTHDLRATVPLHIMFSKKTVSLNTVEKFNKSIAEMRDNGEYKDIIRTYLYPIIILQTVDTKWFYIIDILGTIAFSISGILLAYKEKYDIFGALILGMLPAFGGGVIRDLITNRNPISLFITYEYIYVVITVVFIGLIAIKTSKYIKKINLLNYNMLEYILEKNHFANFFEFFDALGLAAFTVTGVTVAISTQSTPLIIWGPFLAAITSSGGGILRDILRADPRIKAVKGELYPEISAIWGLFLSLFFLLQEDIIDSNIVLFGIITTLIGAFITRLLAVYYKWSSIMYY